MRFWQAVEVLLAVFFIHYCSSGDAPAAQGETQSEWASALIEALGDYEAGLLEESRQKARRIRDGATDFDVARDADVLEAMILMNSRSRGELLDGRSRLRELGRRDPRILDRPECLLAVGRAAAGLAETAAALEAIDQAVDGFLAAGRKDRAVTALTDLADTWLRHGEWEVTSRRFISHRPTSEAQAARVRIEKIEVVRKRAEALTDAEGALAQIDLALARAMSALPERKADAQRLLRDIAGRMPATQAVCEAAIEVAERDEAASRFEEASVLLRKVYTHGPERLRADAERRLREFAASLVEIDSKRVNGDTGIRVRIRNIARAHLEIRRIDLGGWLEERQGRLVEVELPEAGSLLFSSDLDSDVPGFRWWDSDELPSPLIMKGVAEPCVAIVRWTSTDGKPLQRKFLLTPTELRSVCVLGGDRMLIWVEPDGVAASEGLNGALRFWMAGSFVSTRAELRNGLCVLRLPGEHRVLRDRRWVCLVEAAGQVAILRGELPQPPDADRGTLRVVLIGGPPTPIIGEKFFLGGVVIGTDGLPAGKRAPAQVDVEARDSSDRLVARKTMNCAPPGVFGGEFDVSDELRDVGLRFTVRDRSRVLEALPPAPYARAERTPGPPMILDAEVPAQMSPGFGPFQVVLRARYPWGAPVDDAFAICAVRAVSLPTTANEVAKMYIPILRHKSLDARGTATLDITLSSLGLPDGPTAVGVWSSIRNVHLDEASSFAASIVDVLPGRAWISAQPVNPGVLQPVRFLVEWFDPCGRAMLSAPTVTIQASEDEDDAQRVPNAVLETSWYGGGFRSRSWIPPGESSAYRLSTELHDASGFPLTASAQLRVDPGEKEVYFGHARPRIETQAADQADRIRVTIDGERTGPLIAATFDDGPLEARRLPHLHGASTLEMAANPDYPNGHALTLERDAEGKIVAAQTVFAVNAPRAWDIEIDVADTAISPGSVVEAGVRLRGTAPGHVTIMARLVQADSVGLDRWVTDEDWFAAAKLQNPLYIWSGGSVEPQPTAINLSVERSFFDVLQVGGGAPTLSVAVETIRDGAARLHVQMPERQGIYRLAVLAVAANGEIAQGDELLDARTDLAVHVDLPFSLSLGDRTYLSTAVQNLAGYEVDAGIRLEAGAGIEVETLHEKPAGRQPETTVRIPARSVVHVLAEIEAISPGDGHASVFVTIGNQVQSAHRRYRVAAEPAPHQRPAIAIRRELQLLNEERYTETRLDADGNPQDVHKVFWSRLPHQSGDAVSPGTLLLVRETVSVPAELVNITWTQEMPGTALYANPPSEIEQQMRTVGRRLDASIRTLRYRTPRLHPETIVHEYCLRTLRPGSCRIPPPLVRAGDMDVAVRVTPSDTRIAVPLGR